MGNVDSFQKTILYVDDQPSHRALFLKAFQGKYDIVTAASGEEGIEIIKKSKISLIIADHNMPGMSGIDFLEKAQEMNPESEKAILSAYLDDGISQDLTRRVKVAGQLAKPWKLDGMRGYIEKALANVEAAVKASMAKNQASWGPLADEAEIADVPPLPRNDHPEDEYEGELVDEPVVKTRHLAQAADMLASETVDFRGARRIFLNFVEPKIKSIFPLIRKPCAPLLKEAQDKAITGDVVGLEKMLGQYLKEEGLAKIIADIVDPTKKTVH
jgi:CheY-like chemotaxis protein